MMGPLSGRLSQMPMNGRWAGGSDKSSCVQISPRRVPVPTLHHTSDLHSRRLLLSFSPLLSVAEAIDSRKLSFDLAAAGWDFSTEEVAAAGRRDKSSVGATSRVKKEEGSVRLLSGQLPL